MEGTFFYKHCVLTGLKPNLGICGIVHRLKLDLRDLWDLRDCSSDNAFLGNRKILEITILIGYK